MLAVFDPLTDTNCIFIELCFTKRDLIIDIFELFKFV